MTHLRQGSGGQAAKRAQILRLHERGFAPAEICARLLVSWQVVEGVLAEAVAPEPEAAGAAPETLPTPPEPVVDNELNGGDPPFEEQAAPHPDPLPAEVPGEGGRKPIADVPPPLGGRPTPASRQHLVDQAVSEGRVTRCPDAAAWGSSPSIWSR